MTASKGGDITQSSPAPVLALSKCYNGEPHTRQWSNARSSPQLNLALKETKHKKTSTFLAARITRKYTAQTTAAIGLEEHPVKVSLGDFPCLHSVCLHASSAAELARLWISRL